MEDRAHKMAELISLLERHATQEGLNPTNVNNLYTGRASQPDPHEPQVYPPAIVIGAQGRKLVYLEGKRYEYGNGNFIALLVPMAVECEGVEASPEKPMLTAIITIDLNRITNMILNMDRIEKIADYAHSLGIESYRNEIAEQRAEFFNKKTQLPLQPGGLGGLLARFSKKLKEILKAKEGLPR